MRRQVLALAALLLGASLFWAPAAASAAPIITTVPVGAGPQSVAVSPDGRTAYVANSNGLSLSVIDVATTRVRATIALPANARSVTVSPDGRTVYAAGTRNVSIVNAATDTIRQNVPLEGLAYDAVPSPDGALLYVPLFDVRKIAVVDTASGTVVRTLTAADNPYSVAVSPDGRMLYATFYNQSRLAEIDIVSGTLTRTTAVSGQPRQMTLSPDGLTAFTASSLGNTTTIVDTVTFATVRTLASPGALDVAVNVDGTLLAISSPNGRLQIVDTATYTVLETIVIRTPHAAAFTRSGIIYVAQSDANTASAVTRDGPPAFTASAPPEGATVGQAYSYAFAATGNPAPTFRVGSGTLPAGLALSPAGVLSGTPTTTGATTFTVTASNGLAPDAATAPITITTGAAPAAPVFIAATPPATTTVGEDYAYTFAATGNPAPTFAVASGTLPAGLTLSPAGVLSGTPTTAGRTTFTVTATNGVAPNAATAPIDITIESAPAAPVFTASTPTGAAVTGQAYSYAFAATGNPSPTFAVTSGVLPTGLELSTAGVLSGTPTIASSSTFTVAATNGVAPDVTTEAITIRVAAAPTAPTFTEATPPATGTVGQGYSYTFGATGNPAPTFGLASGALPAGLELSAAGVLSGTPTTASSSTFTVAATNGVAPAASTTPITITVAPVAVPVPGRLPAPVITSPTRNQTITSDVTYSGTGTPGAFIALVTYEGDTPPQSSGRIEEAFAAADPIQVSADGTWSRVSTVVPGRYTTFAVEFLRNTDGTVTNSSGASASVSYDVTVPAMPVGTIPTAPDAATGSPSAAPTGGLAYTGSNSAGLAGLGALLAAAGVALTLAIRRRRTTDTTTM